MFAHSAASCKMPTENGRRVAPHLFIMVWLLLLTIDATYAADDAECFSSGSLAGAIIGTFIVTVLVAGAAFFIWKYYWRSRKGKHLVLEPDPENVGDQYAFDNPCFKDGAIPQHQLEKNGSKGDLTAPTKTKWGWSPLSALSANKNDKKRTLDDTYADTRQVNLVSLRSHDFTGLGFNIYGNMRDGIFVKDVLHRGPALESGKINPGDRIVSVRISFAHMVYEDALTILSYASPYEVQLEVEHSGKTHHKSPGSKVISVAHPIYKSSSSGDLTMIGKSVRQRLFQTQPSSDESVGTDYSTLKLSSKPATLERPDSKTNSDDGTLSKPERAKKTKPASQYSPSALKAKLEHSLKQNENKLIENIHNAEEEVRIQIDDANVNRTTMTVESETQRASADASKKGFQKFGVRVLPLPSNNTEPQQANSPKHAESSQNENNINYERHLSTEPVPQSISMDVVDNTVNDSMVTNVTIEPQDFNRQNSVNGSGIKRDKSGIPQEIPDHMLNAANAARKNRKSADIEIQDIAENMADKNKSAKKTKGKAPAPPPVKGVMEIGYDANASDVTLDTTLESSIDSIERTMNFTDNFEPDHKPKPDDEISEIDSDANDSLKDKVDEIVETNKRNIETNSYEYSSDSDADTDQNSVINNTIELNASDITIHHESENAEIGNENRKAASLGDLSKFEKGRTSNSTTLERAMSLDITDTGIPTLCKKRKASNRPEDETGDNFNSDEYIYSKNKEPRLSLALDNLTTFHGSRLKKSSEWGNLEDAIVNIGSEEPAMKSEEIDAELCDRDEMGVEPISKNIQNLSSTTILNSDPDETIIETVTEDKNENKIVLNTSLEEDVKAISSPKFNINIGPYQNNLGENTTNTINISQTENVIDESTPDKFLMVLSNTLEDTKGRLESCLKNTSESLSSSDSFIVEKPEKLSLSFTNKIYETNACDDIKVSRHSLGSLERPKSDVLKNVNKLKQLQSMIQSDQGGVSNVMITSETDQNKLDISINSFAPSSINIENSEVKIIDDGLTQTFNTKVNVEPDLIVSNSKNISQFQINHTTMDGTENNMTDLYTTAIDTSLPHETIMMTEDAKLIEILSKSNSDGEQTLVTPELPISPIPDRVTIQNGTEGPATFVTEIQVTTSSNDDDSKNISEIKVNDDAQSPKKLPEMKFTTSSYESPKSPEKRVSQIEFLRSTFEKNARTSPPKSKIPIATSKLDLKVSPERTVRADHESGDESPAHSTPLVQKYSYATKSIPVKAVNNKNITVTSIKTSSKIPSGHPNAGNYANRPPIPPRRADNTQIGTESSFQQWVFNPADVKGANVVYERKKE